MDFAGIWVLGLLAALVVWALELRGVKNEISALRQDVKALFHARDAASDILQRLEKQLADAPETLSREEESRLSREMQEGVENLLGYSPAQAREAGT